MSDSRTVRPQGPAPLVDVAWLREHLGDEGVLPVEVGADAAAYWSGHVPGAVGLSWLDDLHEPDRRGVLSQRRLETLLGRAGITPDTHLVLYGEQDNLYAAYAYWLLRYYQHPRLSLLDGGRRAWVEAGGPEQTDAPDQPAAVYRSPGPVQDVRATRDLLVQCAVATAGGTAVVDCRRPREYAGVEHGMAGLPLLHARLSGHVPGARNLSHTLLLDSSTGRLRPRPELLDVVAGLSPADDLVLYCDVGERSALSWFVLHELLEYPHVRMYDGGWAEYGSLTGVPVAR